MNKPPKWIKILNWKGAWFTNGKWYSCNDIGYYKTDNNHMVTLEQIKSRKVIDEEYVSIVEGDTAIKELASVAI